MEQEILNELASIRDLQEWIFAISIAVLIMVCIPVLSVMDNIFRNRGGKRFPQIVLKLTDRGQFDAVLSMCEWRLEKFPRDVHAAFYKGKALYAMDKRKEALAQFKVVREFEPTWKKWADPYIELLEKDGASNGMPDVEERSGNPMHMEQSILTDQDEGSRIMGAE